MDCRPCRSLPVQPYASPSDRDNTWRSFMPIPRSTDAHPLRPTCSVSSPSPHQPFIRWCSPWSAADSFGAPQGLLAASKSSSPPRTSQSCGERELSIDHIHCAEVRGACAAENSLGTALHQVCNSGPEFGTRMQRCGHFGSRSGYPSPPSVCKNVLRRTLLAAPRPRRSARRSAWPDHGPMRSSRSTQASASRTSADSAGRVMSLPQGDRQSIASPRGEVDRPIARRRLPEHGPRRHRQESRYRR